jgi:phytoene synthase
MNRFGPDVLAASYARCQAISRRHGTTYYWSTAVLPKDRRPHVHALYAYCRHADDIVDDLGSEATVARRAAALRLFGERFRSDLAAGRSDHTILAAVIDTVRRFDIEPSCFERFLRSMTMDLSVTTYDSFADLERYMDGSAAVIAEMMLPILGAQPDALPPARALGVAFQLTNFLRDVDEDMRRGRVYLPQEDLRRFHVDPAHRVVTPDWRAFMDFQIERTRGFYADADRGLAHLPPRSARCIGAARRLYAEILDRIEAADYDVFSGRISVPLGRKLAVAAVAASGRPLPSRATVTRRSIASTLALSRRVTTGSRNP